MSPVVRAASPTFKAVLCFVLALLAIPASVAPSTTPAAAVTWATTPPLNSSQNTKQAAQVAHVATGTYQNFDQPNTGTPYITGIHSYPPGPQLKDGGPLETGSYMRLSYVVPVTMPVQNSISFLRTNPGAFDLIVADFDFRLTPPRDPALGQGRADGFGFALLNTAVPAYGITGTVVPEAPLFAAEEPNFQNSIGVGFDIYQSSPPLEVSNNHISVHFNGIKRQEVNLPSAFDLADGRWAHSRIILRPGGGHSDVSVILTPCGGSPITVLNQYPIAGFTPYEGRVYFAGRSGYESSDQDIDNINVQFLYQSQSAVALDSTCRQTTEISGTQRLRVSRIGNTSNAASVTYIATNITANEGADYTAKSGTLTFAAGESVKDIDVPILNDSLSEGDENFLISLGNPTGTVIAGASTARVTITDDERGLWSPVIDLPIVPIHMSMLPDGQILMWDRDDHGWDGHPLLWNPTTNAFNTAASPGYDLFCGGHSLLADGRLFVTGGHIRDFVGEARARIYNPASNTWQSVPDMNAGRWYPSNLTLANGDVVVMGGTITPTLVNTQTQVWQSNSNSWRTLANAPLGTYPDYPDLYPWIFLAPNGRVFVAGPQRQARYLDVSGAGTWLSGPTSALGYRDYGSAVMFGNGKIMIVGGNPRDFKVDTAPTIVPSASAQVIDLNATNPSWSTIAPLSIGRRQLVATVLPDGKVLVTGGSSLPGFDNVAGAVLYPEMYDPTSNTWLRMSPHARYRGYHSNAMLLPDGRVLIAGGGHPDPTGGSAEKNAEIYSPPYLFKGSRPVIQCAPTQIAHDRSFQIYTSDAISKVTLIRLPSVTHSFNQNQMFHELAFTKTAVGLETKLPANSNLVPPGYYMLFIVNNNGVPSTAKIVQVGAVHTLCPPPPVYIPIILR